MSLDPMERRLARALSDAGANLPTPGGRIHAVVARGARRRLWARVAAGASGLAAASLIAVASAWAVGWGGGVPPGPAPAASHPDEPDTTDPPTDAAVPTTSPTGETDVVVGTAPPDDSATTTAPPDGSVGTVPPDDSATTTVPPNASVGTVPPDDSVTTTAPPNASVGTTVPESATTTAVPTTTMPLSLPVPLPECPAYGELTDDFDAVRDNNRVHKGIDIIAPKGTPVWAVNAGTVTLRTSGPNGNAVHLTAADGTVFVYAHLLDFAVADGAAVGTGDQLGTIGESGLVHGPQLHFEIHPAGGEAIDPYLAVVAACG